MTRQTDEVHELDRVSAEDAGDVDRALLSLDLVISGDQTLGGALQRIATLLVATVPTIDAASVTLYREGVARTAAFTDQIAAALDERQYHLGSGPCLHAARTGHRVLLDCTAAAASSTPGGPTSDSDALTSSEPSHLHRLSGFHDINAFPGFVESARRVAVRSATALPLGEITAEASGSALPSGLVGVLNTYTTGLSPLIGDDLTAAEVFASRASDALSAAVTYVAAVEDARNLRRAIDSRAAIEQAKGVLMAVLGVDADGAFDELRRRSSHTNRKLRDIAAEVIATTQAEL